LEKQSIDYLVDLGDSFIDIYEILSTSYSLLEFGYDQVLLNRVEKELTPIIENILEDINSEKPRKSFKRERLRVDYIEHMYRHTESIVMISIDSDDIANCILYLALMPQIIQLESSRSKIKNKLESKIIQGSEEAKRCLHFLENELKEYNPHSQINTSKDKSYFENVILGKDDMFFSTIAIATLSSLNRLKIPKFKQKIINEVVPVLLDIKKSVRPNTFDGKIPRALYAYGVEDIPIDLSKTLFFHIRSPTTLRLKKIFR